MSNYSKSSKIRDTFINYFHNNSHKILDSSSIAPENDNTILFTNAGMVQFKKWFTGEVKPKYKNVATVQKCLRAGGKHNDLDNVGFTPRHHTFFEMLGNFSFGGYFKEEAIFHAWHLLTKEFDLDKSKIIITVFKEDSESFNLWKKITGFSDSKILKISTDDNFWSMGDLGPCGPCSEIFFDNGSGLSGGLPGTKTQDGERYIEIWNLVFMEFEKTKSNLKKLPGKFVDTGMGLERLTAVLNNKINNYETDLYLNIIEEIKKLTKKNVDRKNISSFRIISDHVKSITFLMSEGILPSNEGRGYVLRRIIRRASLHCHKLNDNEIILSKLIKSVINEYSKVYFNLPEAFSFIEKNLRNEEIKFSETLSNGLQLLNKEINAIQDNEFSPKIAFKLYDTYGFPFDMTKAILSEKKIHLDSERYEKIVKESKNHQKNFVSNAKIQKTNKFLSKLQEILSPTEFCGYDYYECKSKLNKIIIDDKFKKKTNNKDINISLVFEKTPFYAESGGQVGDCGFIYDEMDQLVAEISDTKVFNKIYVHYIGRLHSNLHSEKNYKLLIDVARREKIRNNHTATHLLHQSLRQIVGNHVSQKGSLVNDQKLRFDYTSNEPLSEDKIKEIEFIVNSSIRSNIMSEIKYMPLKDAIQGGAIALFGEKYPENVRVLSIKSDNQINSFVSVELCGGTHVKSTGEIGFFKIINETSISSGVRRIEAITGNQAEKFVDDKIYLLNDIKALLKANDKNIIEKLKTLKTENSSLKKKHTDNKDFFSDKNNIDFGDTKIYYQNLDSGPKDLKNNSDSVKSKLNSGIVVLTCVSDNKVSVVTSITNDLIEKYDSNTIVKRIVYFLDGKGGGGRKDLAQGGAPLSKKFYQLKDSLKEIISKSIV